MYCWLFTIFNEQPFSRRRAAKIYQLATWQLLDVCASFLLHWPRSYFSLKQRRACPILRQILQKQGLQAIFCSLLPRSENHTRNFNKLRKPFFGFLTFCETINIVLIDFFAFNIPKMIMFIVLTVVPFGYNF
jgi:hypothetical protein